MRKETDLLKQYELRKPALKLLGEYVCEYIVDELTKQLGSTCALKNFLKITPVPRVKETDSFLDKALNRKKKNNPLAEITDQVGVRFVVLTQQDMIKIEKIIEKNQNWKYQKDRDFGNEKLEQPEFFSYQSDHYIISLKDKIKYRNQIITNDLSCEIQVRTLMQHAYAEMSHDVLYKPSLVLLEENAKELRRSLAKGSALIETTDEVFNGIIDNLKKYNEKISSLICLSTSMYIDFIGIEPNQNTYLCNTITTTYREQLGKLSVNDFKLYFKKNESNIEIIKNKREDSIIYKDSVVFMIIWLIKNYKLLVRSKWPIDMDYYDSLCVDLGISPDPDQ